MEEIPRQKCFEAKKDAYQKILLEEKSFCILKQDLKKNIEILLKWPHLSKNITFLEACHMPLAVLKRPNLNRYKSRDYE